MTFRAQRDAGRRSRRRLQCRGYPCRSGWAPPLLLVGGLIGPLAGCGQSPDSPPPPSTSRESPTDTPRPRSTWRFQPTLDANLPLDAIAETVLELSEPRQRSVVIVAAVLRSGADHVELERWTFEQIPNQEEGLRLVDTGKPIARLRPGGARRPELDALRRRIASPWVVLTRPVGIEVSDPGALVKRLAVAFAMMRSLDAEPRARVQALATIVRGLDDTVVLDRDGIAELSTVLVPAPGALSIQSQSKRRARVSFQVTERSVTLEVHRKAEGWVIGDVEISPAEQKVSL